MRKRYSSKAKAELLQKLRESGLSIPAFSRQVGVTDVTLYKWRKESRGDFIEIGAAPLHYEIQRGEVILRVPATERAERLGELMNELSC